jgi:hypothetical protein
MSDKNQNDKMREEGRQAQEDREEREERESAGAFSWAKKIMTVGVGTFFLSEEALKTLVSEFKLPKDIVMTILDGAKGVRKEFMQNFITEVIGKLQDRSDPSVILADFLKKNEVTFEIKVKVKDKTP